MIKKLATDKRIPYLLILPSVAGFASPYASDYFIDMKVLPNAVSIEQYITLVKNPFYFHYLFNSMKLLIPIVLFNLLFSLLAAYSLTQISRKLRNPLLLAFAVTMLLPLQAIVVPHYMVASFLHLSPYLSIVLPAVFNPLGTVILFQFCRAIPVELIEAAKIDGAGHIRILYHMILPLMKNGIITVAVLLSVEYWNIIDQAVVFIDKVYDQQLSVYLVEIVQADFIKANSFASQIPFPQNQRNMSLKAILYEKITTATIFFN